MRDHCTELLQIIYGFLCSILMYCLVLELGGSRTSVCAFRLAFFGRLSDTSQHLPKLKILSEQLLHDFGNLFLVSLVLQPLLQSTLLDVFGIVGSQLQIYRLLENRLHSIVEFLLVILWQGVSHSTEF